MKMTFIGKQNTWTKQVNFSDKISDIFRSRRNHFYLEEYWGKFVFWHTCDKCKGDMKISDFLDKPEDITLKLVYKKVVAYSYDCVKLTERIETKGNIFAKYNTIQLFPEEQKLCKKCTLLPKNIFNIDNFFRISIELGKTRAIRKVYLKLYREFESFTLFRFSEGINEFKIPCKGGYGNRGYSPHPQGKRRTFKILGVKYWRPEYGSLFQNDKEIRRSLFGLLLVSLRYKIKLYKDILIHIARFLN